MTFKELQEKLSELGQIIKDENLTDEQRLELLDRVGFSFCWDCGQKGICYCMNDE